MIVERVPFTEDHQITIDWSIARGELRGCPEVRTLTVSFHAQGNFTMALLWSSGPAPRLRAMGVSKRNTSNPPNPRRGEMLAFAEALKCLHEQTTVTAATITTGDGVTYHLTSIDFTFTDG
jgi:hypothetical protein